MNQCRFTHGPPSKPIRCGVMANHSGYCPRHELLVPQMEAEAAAKEKARQVKRLADLRRGARR
jgi:hypothetical protein